jgi:hypothetical protein
MSAAIDTRSLFHTNYPKIVQRKEPNTTCDSDQVNTNIEFKQIQYPHIPHQTSQLALYIGASICPVWMVALSAWHHGDGNCREASISSLETGQLPHLYACTALAARLCHLLSPLHQSSDHRTRRQDFVFSLHRRRGRHTRGRTPHSRYHSAFNRKNSA